MGAERLNGHIELHCLPTEEALKESMLVAIPQKLLDIADYPPCSVRISLGVVCALAPTEDDSRQGETSDRRLLEMLFAARQAIAKLDYQVPVWEFNLHIRGETKNLIAYKDHTKGPAIHIVTSSEF